MNIKVNTSIVGNDCHDAFIIQKIPAPYPLKQKKKLLPIVLRLGAKNVPTVLLDGFRSSQVIVLASFPSGF